MKVGHCKKQKAFRFEPDDDFSGSSWHSPTADIRITLTSDKIDNVKLTAFTARQVAPLLNDAIPVKFRVPIGK